MWNKHGLKFLLRAYCLYMALVKKPAIGLQVAAKSNKMTPEKQAERAVKLSDLLKKLDDLVNNPGDLKGKVLIASLRGYVSGYSDRDETPDPILYFAILRGGDPREEIRKGIELITK